LLLIGVVIALALLLRSFLSAPDSRKPSVTQIALVRPPPPPPPPPKPQEKPPEPPKIKEEVKIDEPKPDPKPEEAKPADEKPASDKPLGVDAEGTAGSDGFGLAANRGGRDLLSTGSGRGAYYSSLLQRHFFEALSRNRKLLQAEFRVVVRVWLGDDGRVQRAEIVNGSGNSSVDEQIEATLADMSPLRDVPPAAMRPMQLRLSNRS
jgi:periplasmic protein TonB